MRAFLAGYQAALKPKGNPAIVEFKAEDESGIATQTSRYFMPWADAATEQQFDSAASFRKAFVNDGTTAVSETVLIDLAFVTADARARAAQRCEDLGLAATAPPSP